MVVSFLFPIIFCFFTLFLFVEPKMSDEERYVQRQVVNENFIKAGLSESELNDINELVEELGIKDLEQLEEAVLEYASKKLTKEKSEKVKKVIDELKEGIEFMKKTFGQLVGTFLKSFDNKNKNRELSADSAEQLQEIEDDNDDNEEEDKESHEEL